jgi:hypothetical protein
VLGRYPKRDPGLTDLALRPHEPLGERGLRNEKGTRDLRRREAPDEAECQRDLRIGRERRMAAGEDQLEPFVRNGRLLVVRELLGPREKLGLLRERPLPSDAVDRAVPRRRDDPGAGIRRRPVDGPSLRGADEGVLDRILREIEIAEDAAEDRDATCALVAVGTGELVYRSGLISTVPSTRPAASIASSSVSTSIMPNACSALAVPSYGPSVTTSPRTHVADDGLARTYGAPPPSES